MALEATHIKFALDVKDKYGVLDLKRYISGTIYPDSRYISKINRQLTHRNEMLDPNLAADDFLRGWAVHVLCDKVQSEVFIEVFSDYLSEKDTEQYWIESTALKILLDIYVLKNFDIQPYLHYLDHVETRSCEPEKFLHEYNDLIRNLYKDKIFPTIEDYSGMWKDFDLDEDLANSVIDKVIGFQKVKEINESFEKVYSMIVKKV